MGELTDKEDATAHDYPSDSTPSPSIQAKADEGRPLEDAAEYPQGLRFAALIISLLLAMFLIALDNVSRQSSQGMTT
jgi:hypothetical protein